MFSTHTIRKGGVYLILSALCYSMMPLLIRTLNDAVPPFTQVFLRLTVAFSVACFYHKAFSKKKIKAKKSLKEVISVGLLGIIGYAGSSILFTYAVLNASVSTVLFTFYTFPFIVPLLEFLVVRSPVKTRDIISLALAGVGFLCILFPTSGNRWQLGIIFALGAAVTQAYYLIGRRAVLSYTSSELMVVNTFLGWLSAGLVALITERNFYHVHALAHLTLQTYVVIIVFGILNFLGWFLLNKGFESISATQGGVILLSELVFGVIIALVFLDEIPSVLTVVGGVSILCANVYILRDKTGG